MMTSVGNRAPGGPDTELVTGWPAAPHGAIEVRGWVYSGIRLTAVSSPSTGGGIGSRVIRGLR